MTEVEQASGPAGPRTSAPGPSVEVPGKHAVDGADRPDRIDRAAAFAAGPSKIPRNVIVAFLVTIAVLGLGGVVLDHFFPGRSAPPQRRRWPATTPRPCKPPRPGHSLAPAPRPSPRPRRRSCPPRNQRSWTCNT